LEEKGSSYMVDQDYMPISSATEKTNLEADDKFPVAAHGENVAYHMTGMALRQEISGALNIRDYGATGDGVTDDTAALNAFFAALGDYTTGIITSGTYMVSDTINSRNKKYITLFANHAKIMPKAGSDFTDKAVIDMAGLLHSTINGLHIDCTLTTNRPAAGLVIGRTSTEAGGTCTFINCMVEGEYTFSSFYDCCAELNSYYGCFFQSETVNPAYFSSNKDTANLVDVESSNIGKHFYGCTFVNYSGVTGGIAIWLNNAVYQITLDHCFAYIPTDGIVIKVTGTADGTLDGGSFEQMRVEGAGGSGSLLMSISGEDAGHLKIEDITWTIVSDYMIEASKSIVYSNIDLMGSTSATKYIHITGTSNLYETTVYGRIDGGVVLDAGCYAYQCEMHWFTGWPFSGAGAANIPYTTVLGEHNYLPGAWNNGALRIGTIYVWKNSSTNTLFYKDGPPANDNDGTAL
jgi:hypothetical protein